MSADFYSGQPFHNPPTRTESEYAILRFLACMRYVVPATTSLADALLTDVFSVAQIVIGTGLDRHAVIEACSILSAGWSRNDVPADQEPLIIPVLVPASKWGGSEVRFALNYDALSHVSYDLDALESGAAL